MKILYLGANYGTSRHRADALSRLNHEVTIIDPAGGLADVSLLIRKCVYELGGLPKLGAVERYVLSKADGHFDLVLVNGGEYVSHRLVRALKTDDRRVIIYNNDDPFGGRDRLHWRTYLRAIPEYDLVIVMRDINVQEAHRAGAKKVMRVWMSADEVVHAPLPLDDDEQAQWSKEVLFAGTWMPERGPFFKRLIQLGVPLSIYGDRWERAAEWKQLRSAWRGPSLQGSQYVKAIQAAGVSLGLLSQGNRDLHTTRSVEIPLVGGLLCAARTSEHSQMYKEGIEAEFWETPEECADKCFSLLGNGPMNRAMRLKGQARARELGLTNEAIMKQILKRAYED
jgi:hypothetical protein